MKAPERNGQKPVHVNCIRPARPGDEPAIHAAHMRSIRELCVKDHGPEEVRGWANRPLGSRWVDAIVTDHVWVVEIEGTVHGHCYLKIDGENRAHLRGLYLTPEAIGRGLGKRLLTLALERARAAGARKVTLESTLTALAFYRKHGFRDDGPVERAEIGGSQVRYVPMTLELR